jgi:hypothetical protein
MATGVIPGSGVPSHNMTSAASSSFEPSELRCVLCGFFTIGLIVTAAYYTLVVVDSGLRMAANLFSASKRFFQSFTYPAKAQPKLIAVDDTDNFDGTDNTDNTDDTDDTDNTDDTDYTPDQDPTTTIDAVLDHMTDLEDTLETYQGRISEQLSVFHDTLNRIVQKQKLLAAFEEYLEHEASHTADGS